MECAAFENAHLDVCPGFFGAPAPVVTAQAIRGPTRGPKARERERERADRPAVRGGLWGSSPEEMKFSSFFNTPSQSGAPTALRKKHPSQTCNSLAFATPGSLCRTPLRNSPGGTRARNLRIRSPTPCPLGQGGHVFAPLQDFPLPSRNDTPTSS